MKSEKKYENLLRASIKYFDCSIPSFHLYIIICRAVFSRSLILCVNSSIFFIFQFHSKEKGSFAGVYLCAAANTLTYDSLCHMLYKERKNNTRKRKMSRMNRKSHRIPLKIIVHRHVAHSRKEEWNQTFFVAFRCVGDFMSICLYRLNSYISMNLSDSSNFIQFELVYEIGFTLIGGILEILLSQKQHLTKCYRNFSAF